MRSMWLFSVLLICSIITPSHVVFACPIIESHLPSSSIPSNDLQRVYGVNLASSIYGEVSESHYRSYIQQLAAFGSRYILTYGNIRGSNNEQARNWIVDQMTTLSNNRIKVSLLGKYQNVVGILPGYLPGEDLPVFIVSAHYDTVDNCPGANDDASGIAVVLELARVMSEYEWPLDIYFIAFNGDHSRYGLQGGLEVANSFFANETNILALYNVDTILWVNSYAPSDERILLAYNYGSPYYKAQYWAELAKSMSNIYGIDAVRVESSNGFSYWESSDHYLFAQRGYFGSLCVFESGNALDSVYRTVNDVYNYGGYRYYIGAETAGFIGASIAYTMGRAYGQRYLITDSVILYPGQSASYIFPINTPTTINITSRWFGSGADFLLYGPGDILLNSTLHSSTHPWTPTQVLAVDVTQNGLYRLEVSNSYLDSMGADIYIDYDSDIDGNNVKDSQEYWLPTALYSTDSDNDTISDAMEIVLGTDMNSTDSDSDTMPDAYELQMGFDPTDPTDANEDEDGDSLTNAQEYYYGLDPFSVDSDSDGMPDDWELAHGLNPLVNDAEENPDNDAYSNLEEYLRGTNPQLAESEPIPILWVMLSTTVILLLGVGVYLFRREYYY
jgi:hypothetical protein